MKPTGQSVQESSPFKCETCKDQGFVFKTEGLYEYAIKCKCTLLKEVDGKLENSGLGGFLNSKTFANYSVAEEYQKGMKNTAIEFTKDFLSGNKASLAILGQSGIGKTHIMAAVAKELINENVNVKYYIADEIIQRLQSCKFDEENYNIEFNKIANAGVLLIDDLFKSSIKKYYNKESIDTNDLREIFKIINYRYNKKLPILLNSELHFERFRELDEAIIGRINEMCQYKYLVSIRPDTHKNYRLKV